MKFKIPFIVAALSFLVMACSSGINKGSGTHIKFGLPGNGDKSQETAQKNTVSNSRDYNNGPVLLFGDSIARGEGASSPQYSLEGCLSQFKEASYGTYNLAQNGLTTIDAAESVDKVSSYNPSIVLVSLGGNDVIVDSYQKGSFPENVTLNNIRVIFKKLVSTGALVMYLGLNPPQEELSKMVHFQVNTARLIKIKKIALEEGVALVNDSMKGLWGTNKMSDFLHPNDQGYSIVCDRVKSAAKPYLK